MMIFLTIFWGVGSALGVRPPFRGANAPNAHAPPASEVCFGAAQRSGVGLTGRARPRGDCREPLPVRARGREGSGHD